MSFQVIKTIWFGDDYGVEYIIRDSCCIAFNIVKTADPTLVDDKRINIGSAACYRGGTIEDEEEAPVTMETMERFAIRTREESIKFATEMISEHRETLNLSKIFDEMLEREKAQQ